ncbi:tRNA lysidine(34) synthetase TilS [Marivita hallyeonensis]|uniref:tRNA(Ile)-lysidine synthase n=1 Tax=Marivita hallyeonensis TaxID=996342 RepID=A0A1M5NDB3_9RHOB|nr:tRNA lysidine(34) synthetase TilS [Marivita hallyeonensis]SHG87462.1 tRNA(Ile)-lysidine synthase [Marivita hallyeonensis]
MTDAPLDQRFADAMGQLLGPDFPSEIGLAVSGGGDSMAMLALCHNWTRVYGVRLWVVTIDHGLRPESADEARMVAEECAALGWPHATVRWDWDGTGNVMDAARRARLELINRWRGTLRYVLMAHTQDDVAETFLMRLSRGSGVRGLSAMAAKRDVGSSPSKDLEAEEYVGDIPKQWEIAKGGPGRSGTFQIVRPCLGMSRAELRHYLKTLKGRWVDDPSNENDAYLRARMRKLLPDLAEVGLDISTLSETAHRLARADTALRARACQVWKRIGSEGRVGSEPTGELLFDRDGFDRLERDTQMRLLADALRYTSSQTYAPREDALEALLDRILGGGGGTLHGCEVRMERDQLRVFREYNAVAGLETELTSVDGRMRLWDGRWRVTDLGQTGTRIRALGPDGWAQIAEKRGDSPPFHSARSLPSFWRDDQLVACTPLGFGNNAHTRLWPMGREMFNFAAFLLSH